MKINKNQNRIKNLKSPLKRSLQSKPKSCSKPKKAPFDPLKYLNALIQLTHDQNHTKQKHKIQQKRDLSSALTIATPAMEKTISISKIRCKSSSSQYRKKPSNSSPSKQINALKQTIPQKQPNKLKELSPLKQVLNPNLNNYIDTEYEDSSNCIKFTSIQSSTSQRQTPLPQKPPLQLKKIKPKTSLQINGMRQNGNHLDHFRMIDYNFYAKKIQRAWRSYQTYKVIVKHYRHFKRVQKQYFEPSPNLTDMPLTLKQERPEFSPPSVQAYLNNSQNFPGPSIGYSLLSEHEELLSRTVKFKIKNGEKNTFDNQNLPNSQDVYRELKCENSESQNELSLTEKLHQIKQYVFQECKEEGDNFPDLNEECSVEIKKKELNQSFGQHERFQPTQRADKIKLTGQNSTKLNKLNQSLNVQIPVEQQGTIRQQPMKQFGFIQQLHHSPKIKQDFSYTLNKEVLNQTNQNQTNSNSLVDSVIRKETQKYNQILNLIQICKHDQAHQPQQPSHILHSLMKKLQQQKFELELQSQIQSTLTLPKGPLQNPLQEASESQTQSFLAFESKDIYKSFENYQYGSQQIKNQELSPQKQKNGNVLIY